MLKWVTQLISSDLSYSEKRKVTRFTSAVVNHFLPKNLNGWKEYASPRFLNNFIFIQFQADYTTKRLLGLFESFGRIVEGEFKWGIGMFTGR